jgi:signal transduction histidine kinase/ligand-binding sensor domain-containing protein
MNLAGSLGGTLILAATCWAEQPLSAPRVITPTVDAETVRLPVVDARDVRFVRLSRSQGLSQQFVSHIVQDEHGFLWFGTLYGLNRYDGYHFRIFKNDPDDPTSLCVTSISSLFVDRAKKLWVGCEYGLDRYDPVTEKFAHYRFARLNLGGTGGTVRHISQDGAGALWLSTADGLYRFDPTTGASARFGHDDRNQSSLSSDDVKWSGEDREGTFWVATRKGLDAFEREDGGVTEHVPLSVPLSDPGVFSFYEDREGVFWLLYASGNGLAVLDRKTSHVTRYSFGREDLPTHPVTGVSSMLEDENGNLWIGTLSDGLLRFDRDHRRFIRYRNDPSNSDSLTENRILTLFEDRDGDVWLGFGASEAAFFLTQPAAFETLPFDSGNPDNLGEAFVNGIYEDREGIVWMGTTGALVRLDRKTGHLSHTAIPGHGIASDVLSIVEDAAGALWIGTWEQGLYRRPPSGEQLTAFRHNDGDPASISADSAMRLLVDSAGTLWVGTTDGLDRFNPETQDFTTFRRTGAGESNEVTDITEDSDGTLLVGLDPSDVLVFDPRSGSFTPVGGAQQQSRLVPPWLNSVSIDHSGSMWVSSQNGLDRFERPSGRRVAHYTEKDGLPSNDVNCVLEDSSGGLWLGTGAGLSYFDPRRKVFTNYTRADGLPGQDFTGWHACFRSHSGGMFIGGFSGAVAFRPERLATSSTFTPSVVLTSFQLLGKPITPGAGSPLKRAVDYTDRLTLSHDQNSFSFEFSALSFRSPATNRYRFKLEGLNNNWQEVGSDRRYASYTTLPAGTYRFRVQGATIRGPWSEPGRTVDITILPAWWNTWWFRALIAMLLIAAAVALYLLRVRQISRQFAIRLEERVSERTRIARDLHDTLLQSVHGLLLQLQTANKLLPAHPVKAKQTLAVAIDGAFEAATEGRDAVQGLRTLTIADNDLAETIKTLGEDIAGQGTERSPAVLRVDVAGTPQALRLLVRDEIYRVAGEALRNAFHHAGATRVEVDLCYDERQLRLRVRDNGKGVDPQFLGDGVRSGHYGIHGMRERAKLVGGSLAVWSAPGSGTEIELNLPASRAYAPSSARERRRFVRSLFGARTRASHE